jgi:hypothetical protein
MGRFETGSAVEPFFNLYFDIHLSFGFLNLKVTSEAIWKSR